MLEIQSLSVTYPRAHRPALKNFSLAVSNKMGIVGPSGVGKTTLLKAIAGLVPVTAGNILREGVPIQNVHPAKRRIGYVPQSGGLLPHKTVLDNVMLPLRMCGTSKQIARNRAEAMLEQMQIADVADTYPAYISGGPHQRSAIARALVVQPSLLLLDEPLVHLDVNLKQELYTELATIFTNRRVLYVTHQEQELAELRISSVYTFSAVPTKNHMTEGGVHESVIRR